MTNAVNMQLPTASMSGRYRLEVRRNGELIKDTGWFDNLITDAGLEAIGTGQDLIQYAMVGTDNTPPAVGNTTLGAQIAFKTPRTSASTNIVAGPPRYAYYRGTWVFPQGAIVGNVAEIGVGWSSTAVFSRSLTSEVISILAIDQVTLVYELRMYIPTADVTGSVEIAGVTYNYTMRPLCTASNSGAWYLGWGCAFPALGSGARPWAILAPGSNGYVALAFKAPVALQTDTTRSTLYTTDGGATLASYAGASTAAASTSSVSNSAYVANSKYGQFTSTHGVDNGNDAAGIRAFILSGMLGTYQVVLDASIPKDNTKVLTLTWRQSWARR